MAATDKVLPPDLPKDKTDNLVYEIKIAFNQEDWEKMRNVFGEFAQAQVSTEEIEHEFKKLKPIMEILEHMPILITNILVTPTGLIGSKFNTNADLIMEKEPSKFLHVQKTTFLR